MERSDLQNLNLADCYVGMANRLGDQPAVITMSDSISHRQLVDRSFQIARVLEEEGVRAGDRVGLAIRSPIETIAHAIALWQLGAVLVSLDFRLRGEQRDKLVSKFNIKSVLQDAKPSGPAGYVAINIDGVWKDRLSKASVNPRRPSNAGHPAMIMLTSGTSGEPTGIQRGHTTILARNLLEQSGKNICVGGTLVIAQPLNFAAPFNKALGQLLQGGSVRVVPFITSASQLIETVNETAAEKLFVVPKQLRELLMQSKNSAEPIFPHLKSLINGGGQTSADENFRSYKELSNCYQLNYASSLTGLVSELFGKDCETISDSVGYLLGMNNVEIADADGNPVPRGEEGLIKVRGPAMAQAIIGSNRDDSDRIIDGWAIPGDVGVLDANNVLRISGRNSEMIIRGGANVFPKEIENCIDQLSGVQEVAVVGVDDPVLGEEIAAFVTTEPGFDETLIKNHVQVSLPADKRPRHIIVVDSLPRNGMGKVMKFQLKDNFAKQLEE
ncbi:MAG: class I adenylate-forming enzyme family protein [Pseudomonadota bacterium]